MEISILKNTTYVQSTGVEENIKAIDFCSTKSKYFRKGDVASDEYNVYEVTVDEIVVSDFDPDKTDYGKGDVVFKDGCLNVVNELVGERIKQPEEYTPTPVESLKSNDWTGRYMKFGSFADDNAIFLSVSNGDWEYQIFRDDSSGSGLEGWVTFKLIQHNMISPWYANDGLDVTNDRQCCAYYGGTDKRVAYPYPNSNMFSSTGRDWIVGEKVIGADGAEIECGTLFRGVGDDKYYKVRHNNYSEPLYSIQVRSEKECVETLVEGKTRCITGYDCNDVWMPEFIVIRGNDIYIRTNRDDPIQDITQLDISFTEMTSIDQGNWGFTMTRPTAPYAPFDNKNYTFVEASSPIKYWVSGAEDFDTIAINGLIAEEVVVTVKTSNSTIPTDETIIIYPKVNMDENSRLPKAPTTSIIYLPVDIFGEVELEFKSTDIVRIGGITLGQSINAGYSNLIFSNRFKDRSPFEQDQWGNITRVEGAKSNIYTGTVDVLLASYDITNRLFTYISGDTVILNGSDNKDNSEIEDQNFFASTQVVGRIRNFELKTKLDKNLMHQMATYSFVIEEDV